MPFEGARIIFNPLTGKLDVVSENSHQLHFGAGSITESLTDRFLYPNYSNEIAEILTSNELPVKRAGNLRTFQILHNVLGGLTVVIVYTVLVNKIATPLTVGLAANSKFGANTTILVPVVAGDFVSVRATKPSILTNSPRNIQASMEII